MYGGPQGSNTNKKENKLKNENTNLKKRKHK